MTTPTILKGRTWVWPDDVNTDIIIPFRFKARTNDPVLVSPVLDGRVWTCSSTPAECRGHSLTMGQRRRSHSKPRDATATVSCASCSQYRRFCRVTVRRFVLRTFSTLVLSTRVSSIPQESLRHIGSRRPSERDGHTRRILAGPGPLDPSLVVALPR